MANNTKRNLQRVANIVNPGGIKTYSDFVKTGLASGASAAPTSQVMTPAAVGQYQKNIMAREGQSSAAPSAAPVNEIMVSKASQNSGAPVAVPGAYEKGVTGNSGMTENVVSSRKYNSAPPASAGTDSDTMTETVVSKPSYASVIGGNAEIDAAFSNMQNAINDQYNSEVDYANKNKESAYEKAEDQHRIAMRDAQANYKQNDPRYGATAENLLSQGLGDSGYSEYLAGKREEQLTNERMAANSQFSYAKMLADQNYDAAIATANQNKTAAEQTLEANKANIALQRELNSTNDTSGTDYAGLLNTMYNLTGTMDKELFEKMLIQDYPDMTDAERAAYLSNYFDENGNWKLKAGGGSGGLNDTVRYDWDNGKITITDGDGKQHEASFNLTAEQEDMLNKLVSENGGVLPEGLIATETEKGILIQNKVATENDFIKLTYGEGDNKTTVYLVISPNSEPSQEPEQEPEKDDDGSGGSANKTVDLKGSDIIVNTGAKFNNAGSALVTDIVGDDFSVDYKGTKYRVQNGGKATDLTDDELAGISVGNVFGKKGQLYVKMESGVYKIAPRDFLYSGSYGKLVDAIYAEANAKATVDADDKVSYSAEKYAQSDVKERESIWKAINMTRGMGFLYSDSLGSGNSADTGESSSEGADGSGIPEAEAPREIIRGNAWATKGSEDNEGWIRVNVNSDQLRAKLNGIDSSITEEMMKNAGVNNGEVFAIGDELYMRRDGSAYNVDKRFFFGKAYENILAGIKNNSGDQIVADGETGYQNVAVSYRAAVEKDKYKYNDNVTVSHHGDFYKLDVDAVLDKSSDAYRAAKRNNIDTQQIFAYGEDLYAMGNGECYKLGARDVVRNGDYDKLKEALSSETGNRKYENIIEDGSPYLNEVPRFVQEGVTLSDDTVFEINLEKPNLSKDDIRAHQFLVADKDRNYKDGLYVYDNKLYYKNEDRLYRVNDEKMLKKILAGENIQSDRPFGNYVDYIQDKQER